MCFRCQLHLVQLLIMIFLLSDQQELETVNYEYPNISKPWVAEDTCRRPQWPHSKESTPHHHRERLHHSKQHTQDYAQTSHSEGHPLLSADGGADVMFDDDVNRKPIKRIDADPVRKYDVFMPVREDSYMPKNHGLTYPPGSSYQATENNNIKGNLGTSGRTINTRNRTPSQNLQEEFEEMERELLEEMNHNRLPDSFQEQTSHKTRDINIGSFNSVPCPKWIITLVLLSLSYTFALSRLKESIF